MAYITIEEFKVVFDEIDSANLKQRYLDIVANRIDHFTFDRIESIGFDNLTTRQQELIKNANIYGVYHYLMAINYDELSESSGIKTMKIGDLTISKNALDQFNMDRMNHNPIIVELGTDAHKYLIRSNLAFKERDGNSNKVRLAYRVGDDD